MAMLVTPDLGPIIGVPCSPSVRLSADLPALPRDLRPNPVKERRLSQTALNLM
jgi:hypothetical protein